MKDQIFSGWRWKLKKIVILLLAALTLVVTLAMTAHANNAEILVRNGNNYDVNVLKFKQIEYVGQCAGVVISPATLKAKFSSSLNTPAPTRRVIIRNITKGMDSNPYPYTDRGYEQGNTSESFEFSIADNHKTKTFSVLNGENNFEYEIKQRDNIIEKGLLTAVVSIENVGVFPRHTICQNVVSCKDIYEYDYDDQDHRSRRKRTRKVCYPTTSCTCPN